MSDDEAIRVVAVDDEPTTLAVIKQALSKHKHIELVGTGVNGREALQLANRLRPDVILLDVHMPIFNGLEAAARIKAAFPSIGVLILTGETDHEVVKAAMRAGAMDFISKNTEILKIGERITECAGRRDTRVPDRGMAFLWTFYGPKGSAGSTTLAVNTAVHLAQLNYRVLLVDLDMLAGDCGFILGLPPRAPREHLLTQLEEAGEIDAQTVAKTVRSLKLPGNDDLSLHVLDSPTTFVPLEGSAEANLSTLMEFVMTFYDYVVVDLAPGRLFDRALAPLMDFSEHVFVSANRDMPSLKAVVNLCQLLAQTSFSMSKVSLIFAEMLRQPGFNHLAYMRDQNLGVRDMFDMPLDTESASRALQLGMPSQLSSPDEPLAVFTRNLVEKALNLPPSRGAKGTRWNTIVSNFKRLLGR